MEQVLTIKFLNFESYIIMMKRAELLQIPDDLVMNKIYVIRNQKVMLDRD